MRVGTVAGGKHTGNIGAWCVALRLDVARLVQLQPLLENLGVRLMSDSQEETVDGQVVALFVCLAFSLDEVSTFDTVFSIESQRVVFIENLNLLIAFNALLHDV